MCSKLLCLLVLFLLTAQAVVVKPGIDGDLSPLASYTLGLFTNPSGVNSEMQSTIDVLSSKFKLTALFAGEHGIRGDIPPGQKYPSYVDPFTGLPVFSLYDGKTTRPTPDMFTNVTAMVIDIQDVGARCFTYISSMVEILKSCAENKRPLFVLDRINPIGAADKHVIGPVLNMTFSSFVGIWTIPLQHGMTIGELAHLFNEEMKIGAQVHVIKMTGDYSAREPAVVYDRMGWVPPSPNLPFFQTAMLYPGIVLMESLLNVSIGRGTPSPFQVVGASYMNAFELRDRVYKIINQEEPALAKYFSNVKVVPTFFTPTASYQTGLNCNGVQVIVYNDFYKEDFDALPIGFTIMRAILDLYGTAVSFSERWLNLLTGTDHVSDMMKRRAPIMDILKSFEADLDAFMVRRSKYLLY